MWDRGFFQQVDGTRFPFKGCSTISNEQPSSSPSCCNACFTVRMAMARMLRLAGPAHRQHSREWGQIRNKVYTVARKPADPSVQALKRQGFGNAMGCPAGSRWRRNGVTVYAGGCRESRGTPEEAQGLVHGWWFGVLGSWIRLGHSGKRCTHWAAQWRVYWKAKTL